MVIKWKDREAYERVSDSYGARLIEQGLAEMVSGDTPVTPEAKTDGVMERLASLEAAVAHMPYFAGVQERETMGETSLIDVGKLTQGVFLSESNGKEDVPEDDPDFYWASDFVQFPGNGGTLSVEALGASSANPVSVLKYSGSNKFFEGCTKVTRGDAASAIVMPPNQTNWFRLMFRLTKTETQTINNGGFASTQAVEVPVDTPYEKPWRAKKGT